MKKIELQAKISELEEQIKLEYQNLGKAILECAKEGSLRVDALVDRVVALKQELQRIGDDQELLP